MISTMICILPEKEETFCSLQTKQVHIDIYEKEKHYKMHDEQNEKREGCSKVEN